MHLSYDYPPHFHRLLQVQLRAKSERLGIIVVLHFTGLYAQLLPNCVKATNDEKTVQNYRLCN